MQPLKGVTVVRTQAGRPLYLAVRDALRDAIDTGKFRPGDRIPSTHLVSKQLNVSLVTAHRALKELVSCGVLQRAQGRGTYVDPNYRIEPNLRGTLRLAVLLPPGASLSDDFIHPTLEGFRRQAALSGAELVLTEIGAAAKGEYNGWILLSPTDADIESLKARDEQVPTVIVGSSMESDLAQTIQFDVAAAAEHAVNHLAELGHRRISFVGGEDNAPYSRDSWKGFVRGCRGHQLPIADQFIIRSLQRQLDDREQHALVRMLNGGSRPTAIVAGGFGHALNAYAAARAASAPIPEGVSVISLEDAPCAEHLSPALTAIHCELETFGRSAVRRLLEQIDGPRRPAAPEIWTAELIVRKSTAAVGAYH
jgi:DNA-binding LacI/PurR family transcriptional regulator